MTNELPQSRFQKKKFFCPIVKTLPSSSGAAILKTTTIVHRRRHYDFSLGWGVAMKD
jgi:hypothetical protein